MWFYWKLRKGRQINFTKSSRYYFIYWLISIIPSLLCREIEEKFGNIWIYYYFIITDKYNYSHCTSERSTKYLCMNKFSRKYKMKIFYFRYNNFFIKKTHHLRIHLWCRFNLFPFILFIQISFKFYVIRPTIKTSSYNLIYLKK